MLRTSAILIASLSLAAPAFAESVRVSFNGKDAATLHRDIVKAANQVCQQQEMADPLYSISGQQEQECVRLTVASAMNSVQNLRLSQLGTATKDRLVVGSR